MRILRPEEVKGYPEPREYTPEELAQAYALSREAFTAADLQRFTEPIEGVSAEEVLSELEQIQAEYDKGRK